jgi:hypothetical protein
MENIFNRLNKTYLWQVFIKGIWIENAKQLIINYTNLQCLQMLKLTTLAIRDQP